MSEPVLLKDLQDGVLLLTINRPERNNAWNLELEEEYFAALKDASLNPDVKVIVVTGAGKAFCPGMDMDNLTASTQGKRYANGPRTPMMYARLIPKPVIVAVNGACAGIGFIQACAADIRFAAAGAKFTTSFARRGLPAENTISWLLERIVGMGRASDLLLSARVVLAEEAESMGLVNKVFPAESLLDETLKYAKDMAQNCSPLALEAIKNQILTDYSRDILESRRFALDEVYRVQVLGPDFKEGVESFKEKRPPNFVGLAKDPGVEREWVR